MTLTRNSGVARRSETLNNNNRGEGLAEGLKPSAVENRGNPLGATRGPKILEGVERKDPLACRAVWSGVTLR